MGIELIWQDGPQRHMGYLLCCPLSWEHALAAQPLPGLEWPWATPHTRTAQPFPAYWSLAKVGEGLGLQAEGPCRLLDVGLWPQDLHLSLKALATAQKALQRWRRGRSLSTLLTSCRNLPASPHPSKVLRGLWILQFTLHLR